MKRIPIIVVAAIFVVEVALLVLATPAPSGRSLESAGLATLRIADIGDDATGLVVIVDRPKPPGSDTPAPPDASAAVDPLQGVAPPDEPSDRDVIEFENQANRWTLRRPMEFPAAASEVDRILDAVRALEPQRVPSASAKTRENLLLDDAQAIRLTVRRGSEPLADILVGTTNDEGATFIRLHGRDDIFLVEGLRRDDLLRPLDDLRDRQIFDIEPGDVKSLTVDRGRGGRAFVNDGGTWTLAEPDEDWLLDPAKVTSAVNSVARLRAASFADEATVEESGIGGLFGAGALVTFVVEPADRTPTTHRLLVGNPDASGENYYVARDDDGQISTVFLVSKYTIERLIGTREKGLDEYRELRVVRDMTADQVRAVTVTIAGTSITFERGLAEDAWAPAAGSPFARADGQAIAEVVRKLSGLRADDFVAVPGLQMGGRPVTLKELIDGFPGIIREAMTGSAGGASTDELEIAGVLTQNLSFLEQMARMYAVIYPEDAPVAAEALRTLAGELRGTFMALRDPLYQLADRLAQPVDGVPVTWRITQTDGKSITVRIGGRTPDGRRPVGTDAPGDAQVYAVAEDTLGDLTIEDLNDLRDPKLLVDVPPERVTAVAFTDAGHAWQFARPVDGTWAPAPRTDIPDFDPATLAALVRRVVGLQSVAFVRTTPEAAGLATPTATVQLTWIPEAPAAVEGEPPPPAPAPRTIVIRVGAADPEGQRYVNISGDVDEVLASAIFTIGTGVQADLLIDASKVSKPAEVAPTGEPVEGPQPTESLQNLLGSVPPATPSAAPPAEPPPAAPPVTPPPAETPAAEPPSPPAQP